MNLTVRVEPIETAPDYAIVMSPDAKVITEAERNSAGRWYRGGMMVFPTHYLPDGFPSLESTEPVADAVPREGLRLEWKDGQKFDQLHLEVEGRHWTPLISSPIVGEVDYSKVIGRCYLTGIEFAMNDATTCRAAVEASVRAALGMEATR